MNTLLPTNADILEDDALENFLQAWVAAVCGLPPEMVRPRWQPEPANIPNFGVDWCAFGVTDQDPDTYAAELPLNLDVGSEVRLHEKLTCLASFYGPNAGKFVKLFRDGLQLSQNREYLTLQGMGLVETRDVTTVPELVKERWMKRKDLPVIIRRQIVREYAVPTIQVLQATLDDEHHTINIH
jgi:hypothetical protein